MKTLLKIISSIGLILTVLPSLLVFFKLIKFDCLFNLMMLGTVLWFGSTPFWMKKESRNK